MRHAKIQDHRPSGSGKEDFFKDFQQFIARPSCSCDLDHLYKLTFPFIRMLLVKFGFDWPSSFREEDLCNCGRRTDGRRRTTTDGRLSMVIL